MGNIVHLSEAASIALHALIIIAKSDKLVNVQSIAEQTGSSRHHVAKVMQRLAKESIIHSTRGPSGGFQLNKKAEDITLLELYEAIEGKLVVQTCAADHKICPFDKCLLDTVTMKMTNNFKEFISSQTVKDYI
jgi:Rrf2 family protein